MGANAVRKRLIAGNWKMHKTSTDARSLARAVAAAAGPLAHAVDSLVAPPFTALSAVADEVGGSSVAVAAQDVYWAEQGAFTGEVSPLMVAEFASHVIVGHSERRHVFGETDAEVNRKVHACVAHHLTPIVCVGETLDQRQSAQTDDVVRTQFLEAVEGLAADEAPGIILAYEPVWAIGSGLACEPDEAGRVSHMVRTCLAAVFGDETAQTIRILYGGSVKPGNLASYLASDDIDGALVGGASLEADSFAALLQVAAEGN